MVAAVKVFAFIYAVRLIFPFVIRNASIRVLVLCRYLLCRNCGQWNFVPCCAAEVIAKRFLCPFIRRRFNAAPCAVCVIRAKACPMMVCAVIDGFVAMRRKYANDIGYVHFGIAKHFKHGSIVCYRRACGQFIA